MSKRLAQYVPVYYTRVADLFQEVQRETPPPLPPTVRLEPIVLELSGWRAWGVMVTALTGATLHAAWAMVGKTHSVMLTPYKQRELDGQQRNLHTRLVTYAEQRGFTVRPGAYEVADGAFRVSAALPADLPSAAIEGGQE